MTTRQALRHLGDQLPEDQADLARHGLEDLRDAAEGAGRRPAKPLSSHSAAGLPTLPKAG